MKQITTIGDLCPDPLNANKGTARGRSMLEDSLRQYGAGRSIVVDKNAVTLAGNKTLEVAADVGLPIKVVQTDGHELVVVQRTDLDLTEGGRARALAYADNRTGEVDLDWDAARLKADMVDGVDLSQFFRDDELASILADDPATTDDDASVPSEDYSIIVHCGSKTEQATLLAKLRGDGLSCRALE